MPHINIRQKRLKVHVVQIIIIIITADVLWRREEKRKYTSNVFNGGSQIRQKSRTRLGWSVYRVLGIAVIKRRYRVPTVSRWMVRSRGGVRSTFSTCSAPNGEWDGRLFWTILTPWHPERYRSDIETFCPRVFCPIGLTNQMVHRVPYHAWYKTTCNHGRTCWRTRCRRKTKGWRFNIGGHSEKNKRRFQRIGMGGDS